MPVSAMATCARQQSSRASQQRASRLFVSLLLLLALGHAAQEPCADAVARPVLNRTQPSHLPWRGGVVTIFGAAFSNSTVVSMIDNSGGAGSGGSNRGRQCDIISRSGDEITCRAPPSEYGEALVSARAGSCVSEAVLPLQYTGFRWQDAWRWETLSLSPGPSTAAGAPGTGSPAARMGHTLSSDATGAILLYGGLSEAGVLGDVWMLQPEQRVEWKKEELWSWRVLHPAGLAPPARTEHVAGLADGIISHGICR